LYKSAFNLGSSDLLCFLTKRLENSKYTITCLRNQTNSNLKYSEEMFKTKLEKLKIVLFGKKPNYAKVAGN
jgi:hypothetical protein